MNDILSLQGNGESNCVRVISSSNWMAAFQFPFCVQVSESCQLKLY